jgi:hypothetical protein
MTMGRIVRPKLYSVAPPSVALAVGRRAKRRRRVVAALAALTPSPVIATFTASGRHWGQDFLSRAGWSRTTIWGRGGYV